MNKEKLIRLMRENLEINKTYSRQELEELINENNISINITALTYNRWNDGMNDTICLFEYVGRALYKYIDTEDISRYSGYVSHFPLGEGGKEYLIGHFKDGIMYYLNDAKSFKEWKNRNDKGVRIIGVGTKFEVIKNSNIFNFYISEGISKEFINGYGPISAESPLGKIFIGEKEGNLVSFNGHQYSINKII